MCPLTSYCIISDFVQNYNLFRDTSYCICRKTWFCFSATEVDAISNGRFVFGRNSIYLLVMLSIKFHYFPFCFHSDRVIRRFLGHPVERGNTNQVRYCLILPEMMLIVERIKLY